MIKFIHTADVQLGARFAQFGEAAELLRDARVRALRRALEIARDEDADALLIAGDLFEHNQVADTLVREIHDLFVSRADVPIVILPGNHDPVSGPGCLWLRPPFSQPPSHVTVCTTAEPVELPDAVILPSPITQKTSTHDPSLPLIAMADAVPEGKIRIGMTHGSLAIEAKHQPNDHPIALDAATRAGLDYLAVGHWHTFQRCDDGRLVMPGTPEPDQFGQDSGAVLVVEIDGPGASPRIRQVASASLVWREIPLDVAGDDLPQDLVTAALTGSDTPASETVLRVELNGAADPEKRRAVVEVLREATADFAVAQIRDRSSTRLSDALWQAWQRQHPLLAQAVADIGQARSFYGGHGRHVDAEGLLPLTLPEMQALCREAGVDDAELNDEVFESMLTLLAGEVSAQVDDGAGS